MGEERRRRTRVPVHFNVTIQVEGAPVSVETKNISLNGMLCEPNHLLKGGTEGQVRIVLSPDVTISAVAKIVRSDATGIAVGFASVDEDSFFHLKNLVQYNTEDADLIEKELQKAGF